MARILSAIPQVKRRAIEITARPGVDKLGPSGIAREWRNARYDYVRAPARPHTPRSSRQDPPSQTTGGRLVSTEGARRRCRRAPAGRLGTTEGAAGIRASQHQFYLEYIKSPSRAITRQLKSDIRECVKATRMSSQYESSGNSMQKMDGGQARKAGAWWQTIEGAREL